MAKIFDKMAQMRDKYLPFYGKASRQAYPGGNVLQNTSGPDKPVIAISQDDVNAVEPYGTRTPQYIKGRTSGWSQLNNLTATIDIVKVQAALRAAERGRTEQLFTYYRDLFMTSGIVASELSKRKLAIISEPYTILPYEKGNSDDEHAAKVIQCIIDNCPKWNEGLAHLMNAIIFPVSVAEKIVRPANENDDNSLGVRYFLKELFPVEYILINYWLPYLPQGPLTAYTNQPVSPFPPLIQSTTGRPEDTIYDLDSFEPNMRFWHVFQNGLIDYAWSNIYAPDPERHLVYRANLLQGVARDNFGGLGRSIMFWCLMAQLGREFFIRCLDRWGIPFVVANVDTSQVDTVKMLEEAFSMSNKLGALMVNKDALITIKEINMANAAEGHKMFLDLCHDQISLLISGHVLSTNPRSTGMGSGVAKLQATVREDIIAYDQMSLSTVLRDQLFGQLLKINGVKGRAPRIQWGGEAIASSKDMAITLNNLAQAGIRPSPEAMDTLSQKFGFTLIDSGMPETGSKPVKEEKDSDADNTDQDTPKEND